MCGYSNYRTSGGCGSGGCGCNYTKYRQYNSCGGYTKEVIVCGGSVEYRPVSSGCGSGGCGGGC